MYRLSHRFRIDADGRTVLPRDPMAEAARHYRAQDHAAAEACCREVLLTQPEHFDALHLLGVVALAQDRPHEAIDVLRRAAALRPGGAQVRYNLANALAAAGQHADAVAGFAEVVALRSDHLDAINNRGAALVKLGRDAEAMAAFHQVLSLRSDFAPAQFNLGRLLRRLDHPLEALALLERAAGSPQALADSSRMAEILAEICAANGALGRYDAALRTCAALRPHHSDIADWNESLIRLTCGDYAAGWPMYEKRWGIADHDAARPDQCVLQLDAVAGKRVLLGREQGRGDMIQFARYAPLLARHGARVVVSTYDDLVPLLRTLDGVEQVIGEADDEPEFDLMTPLMSLPLAFRTELSTVPSDTPYLRVPARHRAGWLGRVERGPAPAIGIAWSGATAGARMPLASLLPLLRRADCAFHVLQKEIAPDDRAMLAGLPRITVHAEALHDFADTAALIEQLDLVIAIDTSVAHLAAAMAKPTWIMLPFAADWRWLLQRGDSPWYPTARLFRQPRRADWPGVVADVIHALNSSSCLR